MDVLEAYPVEASAPRMSAVASTSPSEKAAAPSRGGRAAASPSAASIARATACSRCQTSSTSRALGPEGGGDVGERGDRIVEEHRPESADRHVEPGVRRNRCTWASPRLVAGRCRGVRPPSAYDVLKHGVGHVDPPHRRRADAHGERAVLPRNLASPFGEHTDSILRLDREYEDADPTAPTEETWRLSNRLVFRAAKRPAPFGALPRPPTSRRRMRWRSGSTPPH